MYLAASTNNRAGIVLGLLLQATQTYGWPLQVQSDQRLENADVARTMLMARVLGRASHTAGANVHSAGSVGYISMCVSVCSMRWKVVGYCVQLMMFTYSVSSMFMCLR